MLIRIDNNDMLNAYTVDNKDIERMERIQRRQLPHLRKIKLYSKKLYVPVGQFSDRLKKTKELSKRFEYIDNPENVPKDIIDEQDYIMMDIWINGKRTWLIEMKTARGKGNLLLKLIAHFQEPTLILVHNQKTLQEMKGKFADFTNWKPWEWWSKKKDMQEIMITTHASFKKNVDMFSWKFWIIFYDEADVNLKSNMITALAEVDADGLFWLTGTPNRQELDLQDLEMIYWPHIKFVWQKNNWYNMIPNIYQLKYNTEVCSYESFHDLVEQLIAEKDRVKKQIDFVKHVIDKFGVSLFLVNRVAECYMYKKFFDENGIPNTVVNGKTKLEDDDVNIKDMVKKKGIIIGTSGKMWRGVDIPQVQAVFLFYPTRFEGNVVQAVWRALRSYPWKDKVFLFDWSDSIIAWQWYQRITTYRKEYPWCNIKTLQVDENSFILNV